ncbi:MAG: hypothetical protein IKH06_08220 [Clostridiales bacterium]|nr:hypothetical protein [Clostridiales bacterium]
MLDSLKDKFLLPLIYAAAVIFAAIIAMFLFFNVSPAWLRFLPVILMSAGFVGGFALSFVPIFKGRKFIPVVLITVAAVLTGIVIVVL